MAPARNREFDVLIVGGGPAGLAAAVTAGENGARVGIVDDNPSLGGQIWRGESDSATEASYWIGKLREQSVEFFPATRVFDQLQPGVLRAETGDGFLALEYRKLILATGARERFLPFPGWTLPNVLGAGGLQALVKSSLPISGKRVVVAGTGPLLLAVAAYLRKRGAEIPMVCEQASRFSLAKFSITLLWYPEKVHQARSFRRDLAGVRFITNCWPIAAEGNGILRAVVLSRGNRTERVSCDYLACGFHLVPNTELASLLGCRLRDGFVYVDEFQQTSIPDVFCAGEPTGIGGVELSLVEGQIAGSAAAGRSDEARKLFPRRRRLRSFARILDRTYALRAELKTLAVPDTIVCRCEDVNYGHLRSYSSWRAAKLQTRCGMGPCQRRVCGPAVEFLLNWTPESTRPPIFPTTLRNLGGFPSSEADPAPSESTRGDR